ncbi:MAG: alanine--glyoxylate aminotransferase family protein [Betaproteobacteria bacterium]|nr:alanine--glyoxylate aminotransferase family protein [Betaproteobacteria bacterium]MSQ88813.1 alanine--glyoxylate aminotransferase family protein [Betaproteobacteria bacterium]
MDEALQDLNPAPRLLMGPGPINADPRVLRAMSAPLLGQFDPQFRAYMRQTSALLRGVFQTANPSTLVVDGTARSGIEAALVSLIEPGDRVLVPVFGRFGHLKVEIAKRCGADVRVIETEWGRVFPEEILAKEIRKHQPKLVAISHGDTSTTMAQPLAVLGRLCREHDALLYVDATATLGGMDLPVDAWHLDVVSAGLQKCLGGPSGAAPLTLNARAEQHIFRRRHTEQGLRTSDAVDGEGPVIRSNYLDLAMIMDYWSDRALNHHTEATSMLYAARECARILMQEGLASAFARHVKASTALTAGLGAMGLTLFGDQRHKMPNVTGVLVPQGVEGEKVRRALLGCFGIEIGSSFGPLHGKIWRIGTMGYNARQDAVLITLSALEAVLSGEGVKLPRGAAVDAALAVYGRN